MTVTKGLGAHDLPLAGARRFRSLKHPAQVTYRCQQGDLLLQAWQTPSGILWYAPSVRVSRDRADQIPGQYLLQAREIRETDGALVAGERSGFLGSRPVPLLCRHVAADHSLKAEELAVEVGRALRNNTPIAVVLASSAAHR